MSNVFDFDRRVHIWQHCMHLLHRANSSRLMNRSVVLLPTILRRSNNPIPIPILTSCLLMWHLLSSTDTTYAYTILTTANSTFQLTWMGYLLDGPRYCTNRCSRSCLNDWNHVRGPCTLRLNLHHICRNWRRIHNLAFLTTHGIEQIWGRICGRFWSNGRFLLLSTYYPTYPIDELHLFAITRLI